MQSRPFSSPFASEISSADLWPYPPYYAAKANEVVNSIFAMLTNEERIAAEENVRKAMTEIAANPAKAKLQISNMSDESVQRLVLVLRLFYNDVGNANVQQEMFANSNGSNAFAVARKLFSNPYLVHQIYVIVHELINKTCGLAPVSIPREPKQFQYEADVADLFDTFVLYYHIIRFGQGKFDCVWDGMFCDIITRGLGEVFLTYVERIYGREDNFAAYVARVKERAKRHIVNKQDEVSTLTSNPELLSAQAEKQELKLRMRNHLDMHEEVERRLEHATEHVHRIMCKDSIISPDPYRAVWRDEESAVISSVALRNYSRIHNELSKVFPRSEAQLVRLQARFIEIRDKCAQIEYDLVFN